MTAIDGQEFSGKVAVVAGGSTGMGRAAVERLVRGGAAVFYCTHDPQSLAEAERALHGLGPGRSTGRLADVSSAADMAALMQAAIDAEGGIDMLANCAGIQRYGTVLDTDEALWDEVMAVNLKGCFLASKYAARSMIERGGGAIVHVSSVQAMACQTNVAAYATSKGGVNALTRSMALDLARYGIRVNTVCPGSVDTPMLRASADLFKGDKTVDETVLEWGMSHPLGKGLGRVCTVEEVAEVIAFLLSDRASFVTGDEIKVDGALLAGVAVVLPD